MDKLLWTKTVNTSTTVIQERGLICYKRNVILLKLVSVLEGHKCKHLFPYFNLFGTQPLSYRRQIAHIKYSFLWKFISCTQKNFMYGYRKITHLKSPSLRKEFVIGKLLVVSKKELKPQYNDAEQISNCLSRFSLWLPKTNVKMLNLWLCNTSCITWS